MCAFQGSVFCKLQKVYIIGGCYHLWISQSFENPFKMPTGQQLPYPAFIFLQKVWLGLSLSHQKNKITIYHALWYWYDPVDFSALRDLTILFISSLKTGAKSKYKEFGKRLFLMTVTLGLFLMIFNDFFTVALWQWRITFERLPLHYI